MRDEDEESDGVQLRRRQLEVEGLVEGGLLRPVLRTRLLLLDDSPVRTDLKDADIRG